MLDWFFGLPFLLQVQAFVGSGMFVTGILYLTLVPENAQTKALGRLDFMKRFVFLVLCAGAPLTLAISVLGRLFFKLAGPGTKRRVS